MTCTCPEQARGWWDCLDCPEHGADAAAAGDADCAAEMQAENAWLRYAEYDPRMNDPREW